MNIYLETERMILRRFTEADVDNLCDLDSDPDVMRFINGVDYVLEKDEWERQQAAENPEAVTT